MLQFASEYLPAITADWVDIIARKISPFELLDFQRFEFPGKRRIGWTYPGSLRRRGVHLGSLYWPRDASRFGVAYLLATDSNLANIRAKLSAQVSQETGSAIAFGPGELIISEENQQFQTVGKVTASMWMLPARPLSSIIGQQGMNLITLVDDRYWWWFRDTGQIAIVPGETTWADLYDLTAQALGVDIEYDAISPNYLEPGAGLAAQYEQSPMLLDAIAYNVGQRICVDLDGSVHAYSQSSSQQILQGTLSLLQADAPRTMFRTGGGFISAKDRPLLLPSAVRVAFPRSVGYVDLGQSYAVEISLADLNIQELGTVGNGNIKLFHDSCAAEGPTASTPINATSLTNLAKQIAIDWYLYQLGPLDSKFEGVVDWTIEGLSDSVTWTFVKGELSTRVTRPSWNCLVEELLHGPAPTEPPCWVKVINSTPQTITLTSGSTRSITATVSSGERILINQNADFTDKDRGASVSGTGIPSNTTILDLDGSSQAVMSNAATETLGSVSLALSGSGKTLQGFSGVVEQFIDSTGTWLYWDAQHQQWATDSDSINWSQVVSSVWFRGANNETPTSNVRYQCRLLGQDENGVPIWGSAISPAGLASIKVTSANPAVIYIGRQVTDGVLNGTTTLTSATANFTNADSGSYLIGNGIPAGTTVQSVTNSTTCIMSKPASTSATNVTVTIGSATEGYQAEMQNWNLQPPPQNSVVQDWQYSGTKQCWFLSPNSPDPANPQTVSPHNQFPLMLLNYPLPGQQVSSDINGVPIFVWPYDPAAFWDQLPTLFQQQNPLLQAAGIVQYGYPGAQAKVSMGQNFLMFGAATDQGQAYGPSMYVAPSPSEPQVAPQAYAADTGMDSQGNQLVSGVNVAIGGGATFISGGSDP
jgi:hypothetical protein